MPVSRGELYQYLSKRVGISKATAKDCLTALSEYTAIQLGEGLKVTLPGIGVLSRTKVNQRARLKITTGSVLSKYLSLARPLKREYFLKHGLKPPTRLTQFDRWINQAGTAYLAQVSKNPLSTKWFNTVHFSLLAYLQSSFIWGHVWVHPISHETFSADLIKTKLVAYQHIDLDSYQKLFLVWINLNDRHRTAESFGWSEQVLYEGWKKALNGLLLLLLFPELDPILGEILIQDVRPRPRESGSGTRSKRHGLYRTTGIYNSFFRSNQEQRSTDTTC
jgi:nucleoid DNA-binding protein